MKKLLWLILFLGISGGAYARTYQEVIDNVRIKIRDNGPTSSEYRYSDSNMLNAINKIEEEMLIYTEPKEFRKVYKTTTTAGQKTYNLPNDILNRPLRVAYYISSDTNTFERLDYTTIPELDKSYGTWEQKSSGSPEEYYFDGDKIGLYPKPSATYSTDTWKCLKIEYMYNPTDIGTSTLNSTIFGGATALSPYGKVLEYGVISELTGNGIDVYYKLLNNMRSIIKKRMDFFNNDETFYE